MLVLLLLLVGSDQGSALPNNLSPSLKSKILPLVKTMEHTSNVVLENANNLSLKETSNSVIGTTLNYLGKILLEEEIHENDVMYREGLDLWAMEKHFYDIVGEEYPLRLNKLSLADQPKANPSCSYFPLQRQATSSSKNIHVSGINEGEDKDTCVLSNTDNMASNSQANKKFHCVHKKSMDCVNVNLDNEEIQNQISMLYQSKGKKKLCDEDSDLTEGRHRKILMPYEEEPIRDRTFDEVLLYHDFYTKEVTSLREIMQTNLHNDKKTDEKVLDFEDLLISCSHSIAKNDRQTAGGLIKEIRKQSSPDGDKNQRLAHVLADALEARLKATGDESCNNFFAKRISTTNVLKVHHLFMTVTPFPVNSLYLANQNILKAAEKASKLHIIDFGISYGFQWPSLIQMLSNKKEGTIKLRITGIDFPLPGFRPDELVEETGRRLKEYAKMFDVPFAYHGIVSQWETIHVNDLKIEKDEMLIVNSLNRFRQLGDETTGLLGDKTAGLDCPRDQVIKLIHQIKPHMFIFGIFSWTFSPFFVTRFKQAMQLYEIMFDLMETLIPRDNQVRPIIERDMLARDAINLIACEGATLVERPETYKRWHQRMLRAGFEQIPLDPTIMKKCKKNLRKFCSSKMFSVEEGNNWFLHGWRGRVLYGHSTWKPK